MFRTCIRSHPCDRSLLSHLSINLNYSLYWVRDQSPSAENLPIPTNRTNNLTMSHNTSSTIFSALSKGLFCIRSILKALIIIVNNTACWRCISATSSQLTLETGLYFPGARKSHLTFTNRSDADGGRPHHILRNPLIGRHSLFAPAPVGIIASSLSSTTSRLPAQVPDYFTNTCRGALRIYTKTKLSGLEDLYSLISDLDFKILRHDYWDSRQ